MSKWVIQDEYLHLLKDSIETFKRVGCEVAPAPEGHDDTWRWIASRPGCAPFCGPMTVEALWGASWAARRIALGGYGWGAGRSIQEFDALIGVPRGGALILDSIGLSALRMQNPLP